MHFAAIQDGGNAFQVARPNVTIENPTTRAVRPPEINVKQRKKWQAATGQGRSTASRSLQAKDTIAAS
jgi:hypothetical protein